MDPRNKHGLTLLEQLWIMRETGKLTDVVLVAEGISFPCHRVVLSAFSPYFRVMFTCGLSECSQREVTLGDMPADSLALLLNYMYLSDLPLTNTNVQGVSTVAFMLQMEDVFSRCQQHMMDHMDASNCLGVYFYARELGAEELGEHAQRYLRQHFAEVCLQEEILELQAHQLLPLVASDDLNVTREESILEVVLRWVSHRQAERAPHLLEVLRKVRLPLVAPDFLRDAMRRNPVLLANAECLELVEAALDAARQHPAAAPRRLKLRYGMETTDLLLCIGNDGQGIKSRQGSYSDYSFCYTPATGRTCYITSPRYGEVLGYVCAGVVTEDNEIVVAGEAGARRMARQKSRTVDICRYKATAQGSWEKLCSVEYREMYALGAMGDMLYLLGGQMKLKNQYLMTNSVERWPMKGGPWRRCAPLPIPLSSHCVVSLKGHLYVLGGRTPQSDRPDDEPDHLSSRVFQFDPEANKWEERGPMKYSKYRCSAVVLNGEIYVLGGIGCEGVDRGQSRRCLDVVEIYNPDGDFWRIGPQLPYPLLSLRSGASNAGVAGGKLYVCGFYRGADRHDIITKDILELDPWENVWTMAARRVLMHDNYDVCLVANLNPRNLVAPPGDLLDE
ncbi:kelch repeat and BTB domain-containing protein 12-like [Scleropages formosus]|uniref:Kelch repeat and BTB domain-containing protein 12-like n=1 Tax=Scleropages formosus TaxID=113540 RepID=A0A0P7V180_SCLFO|nr:kelch repeat and BTB domain-containing protein 12-like [Scleropages formosus]